MPQRDKLDPQTETLNRVRRMETRLTALLISMGVDTQAQKPVFVRPPSGEGSARVQLPSPHSSFKEILGSIPSGWAGEFDVMVGDDFVARLVVADRT